jgi:alpha-tubulin suppressor-like RCC1 family protein
LIFFALPFCDCSANIEEKHCQPGCVDERTRLVCEGGRPRAVRCPEYSEPCVKAVCSEGECRPKPDVGKACGQGGLAQCTEGYACLGPRVRLSSLHKHTCALDDDGRVWCWGENSYGQLGDGTLEPSRFPVPVRLPGRAIDVSAGFYHTCALLESGTAYCWGHNDFSGTAPGPPTVAATEAAAISVPGVRFTKISSGGEFTCAMTERSTVYCWGETASGQCGIDGMTLGESHTGPVQIGGLTNVRSIASGFDHTCAVRNAAPSLVCWGSNSNSKLGPAASSLAYSPTPVPVELGTLVLGVSVGYESTYALTSGALVYSWGANDRQQLGTSDPPPIPGTPSMVEWYDDNNMRPTPLANVADLPRAGVSSACAKIQDLAMRARYFCWGTDEHGELGFAGGGKPYEKARAATILPRSADNMSIGIYVTCITANETGATEIWCYGLSGLVANGTIDLGSEQLDPLPIKWNPESFEKALLQ